MEKEFYVNINTIRNKFAYSSFQLFLTTENNYLSISVLILDNNQYYGSHFTLDKLIYINKNFANFTSLNQIFDIMSQYFYSNFNKININISQNEIKLHCPEMIHKEEIIFNLCEGLFVSHQFDIINNKYIKSKEIIQTTKEISLTNNYYDKLLYTNISSLYNFSHINIWIWNSILSFTLLMSLIILFIRYLTISYIYSQSLIASKNELLLISKWIDSNYLFDYILLYRASRDGDYSKSFHELCDQKGNTLTLISTQEGWRFGGYSDTNWITVASSIGSCLSRCRDCFIFSLNKKERYLPRREKEGLIMNINQGGPSFGFSDIEINDYFFTNKSKCKFPRSFGNNNSQSNVFNGGKNEFIVKEIEVFLVEKQKLHN